MREEIFNFCNLEGIRFNRVPSVSSSTLLLAIVALTRGALSGHSRQPKNYLLAEGNQRVPLGGQPISK